jgi:hypothetical protein
VKRLRLLLRILMTPSCWCRLGETDRKLSRFINDSLESGHTPERICKYTVSLNGRELWVRNYAYGYGAEWWRRVAAPLPDRATVFRLRDAVRLADQITLENLCSKLTVASAGTPPPGRCDQCRHYRFGAMSFVGPDIYRCELHNRVTLAADTCDQFERRRS